MKLHFEPNLEYQHAAIQAVCDLFRGQEICRTEFTVTNAFGLGQLHSPCADHAAGPLQLNLPGLETDLGIGNRLQLLDDELLTNLADIQLRNGLKPSPILASRDFTVEMETGTGKTYVYLRTIFELNRQYGFTKFVIVVPSIAIKEGVYKTLQITADHFKMLYTNMPFEYFLYDSSKLGQVRNFATSSSIQIMVMTVGAINKKDVNNLYKDSEKTGGEKPIHLIRAAQPIIIVDEPQSVDGGLEGRGKEALSAMNPLCTLRYSATHVDKHHMVYRLDAVDAYEQKLVKQIEVASLEVHSGHNDCYLKLLSTNNKNGLFTATVEIDVQHKTSVKRKAMTIKAGDDLEQISGRAVYANLLVKNIGCKIGEEFIELSNLDSNLRLGEAIGDVDADALKRLMIRRTIEEHLDKELRLRPRGIKVLSLFFIDLVEHYRSYDSDGVPIKGKYALMFEDEYKNALMKTRYHTLFKEIDIDADATEVHDGYFSVDKNRRWSNTTENNQNNRENAERAYNLIMQDKEKLLSFDTKLKFIFSHSALREGWDNPNVFQICAIRDIGSERERRQTLGRGLRLCVNQKGERERGFEVNTLTVIATEGYEAFAENLQREIERDTGIRFGIVEKHQFATLPVRSNSGSTTALGVVRSEEIWMHLKNSEYIDAKGKILDTFRKALKDRTFDLPKEYEAILPMVSEILKKLAGKLEIKNADERRTIRTRNEIWGSTDFLELWKRIRDKTTYRVQFDNEKLLTDCIDAVSRCAPIEQTSVHISKADLSITRGGVSSEGTATSAPVVLESAILALPDVLTDLQNKTQLTRRSLARILTESGRLNDFKRNPQKFIELTAESINRTKRLALVDGIKYQRIGNDNYYAQELFLDEELTGYLNNMVSANKSLYEYVAYDSTGVERQFAEELEKNEAIKLYVKLPNWFKLPTPLGSYNPDWAILVENNGAEQLYFVVETKSSLFVDDIRDKESAKIECGKAHFKALATGEKPAKFVVARNINDLMAYC